MSPLTFAHVSTSWWMTHSHSKKNIKESNFLFFLFIIWPILETFLFVSGRFARVNFAVYRNLKQSRTVSCVLFTEKAHLAAPCTFQAICFKYGSSIWNAKKFQLLEFVKFAKVVYTSQLFNRESIKYEFLFPPISRIYKTWQASWRQRAPRGPWNELKDFDLINHCLIFRDKEVNVFIRVVMSRNLEHFKLATDTKDDHNKHQ